MKWEANVVYINLRYQDICSQVDSVAMGLSGRTAPKNHFGENMPLAAAAAAGSSDILATRVRYFSTRLHFSKPYLLLLLLIPNLCCQYFVDLI